MSQAVRHWPVTGFDLRPFGEVRGGRSDIMTGSSSSTSVFGGPG
jgi:hypothetical protein